MTKKALVGLILFFLILLFALVTPLLTQTTYFTTHLIDKNLPPSYQHLMGTDDLGRDMLTRMAYGARISLFIGICAALVDCAIGVLWGSIAAFAGGKWDTLLMRIADILYGIPYLLVVILLMVVMGSGIVPLIIALCSIGWITMARIVRAQILQLKSREFLVAAKALGASRYRQLFSELLPNASSPIIVTMTFTVPAAIFSEAFLSFLGLGIQAPVASWGTMASEGLSALQYYPWRLFFPAMGISVTILSFNLIGEGLNVSS